MFPSRFGSTGHTVSGEFKLRTEKKRQEVEEWQQNQETNTQKASRRHKGRRVEGYHVRVREWSSEKRTVAAELKLGHV